MKVFPKVWNIHLYTNQKEIKLEVLHITMGHHVWIMHFNLCKDFSNDHYL
jgi:hypothetical protein